MSLSKLINRQKMSIVEEAATFFKEKDGFNFRILDSEGLNIPHFHVYYKTIELACLKFNEPEYFLHGKHTGTLSRDDLKTVNKLLDKRIYGSKTIFQYGAEKWNEIYSISSVSQSIVDPYNKPDYNQANKTLSPKDVNIIKYNFIQ